MQELRSGGSGLKAWPVLGIVVIQGLLFSAHWFIYHTLIAFSGGVGAAASQALGDVLFVMSLSFVAAALLGFYSANWLVTALYRIAAVWLGLLNFFFLAALLCWVAGALLSLLGASGGKPQIEATLFALALIAGVYGLVNARTIRIRRATIKLPDLPASWRGRTALVLSDTHLGHVNGPAFIRRIVAQAARLSPDIILLPGDIFDGSKAEVEALAIPLGGLNPAIGSYFVTGNHDEFGDTAHYAEVLTNLGIRVLDNEMVTVEGLQIAGVSYGSTSPIRLQATLQGFHVDPDRASILLNHVPTHLPIVEQAGISLQISGHTHAGQIFPFTWFTRRAFGKFTCGLQQFGALQVFTSSGAGTWGPPMRVGTRSEMALLTFE